MKRFLPVLLSALVGAIGLPVMMSVFQQVALALFPQPVVPPIAISRLITTTPPFIHSTSDLRILVVGALLGCLSTELWRNERTFWLRFRTSTGSASVFMYFVWNVVANYRAARMIGLASSGSPLSSKMAIIPLTSTASWYLPIATFYSPPILWSLSLLFFAVLAKRRPNAPLP